MGAQVIARPAVRVSEYRDPCHPTPVTIFFENLEICLKTSGSRSLFRGASETRENAGRLTSFSVNSKLSAQIVTGVGCHAHGTRHLWSFRPRSRRGHVRRWPACGFTISKPRPSNPITLSAGTPDRSAAIPGESRHGRRSSTRSSPAAASDRGQETPSGGNRRT